MLRYIENIEENLILEQYIRNCNYNKKYNVGKKLWTIDSVLGIKIILTIQKNCLALQNHSPGQLKREVENKKEKEEQRHRLYNDRRTI